MPADAPVTTPDAGMIAAILLEEEVHKPPVVASINVVLAPEHTDSVAAVMVAGKGLTVTVA